MYTVYILQSNKTNKFYIGETSNLERRLKEHRQAKTSFGKINKSISLIYSKKVQTLSEARKMESFLKRQKSHKFIEKLIEGKIIIPRSRMKNLLMRFFGMPKKVFYEEASFGIAQLTNNAYAVHS